VCGCECVCSCKRVVSCGSWTFCVWYVLVFYASVLMNICIIWVQWLDNNAFDITDARYNHEDYQKLRLTSFYTTCDPINTTGISHLEILNKNSSKTAPKFRHSLPILLQRNFFFLWIHELRKSKNLCRAYPSVLRRYRSCSLCNSAFPTLRYKSCDCSRLYITNHLYYCTSRRNKTNVSVLMNTDMRTVRNSAQVWY